LGGGLANLDLWVSFRAPRTLSFFYLHTGPASAILNTLEKLIALVTHGDGYH
jgi:hypothetical protein